MKLVTTLLLAATCSVFALDDGPIFQCDSRGEARKTVSPHVSGASLESPLSMSPER